MDLILRGVERLPDWGRGVECADHFLTTSGQAGYLALGLGALRVETEVLGNVGNDDWGARIVTDLEHGGVGVEAVEVSATSPTALCVAIARSGDGERCFIGSMAHLGEFDNAMVERHRATLDRAEVVCVVGVFDLARFGVAGAADLLAWVRRTGKETLLDSGGDPEGWQPETVAAIGSLLPDVSYLVVNSFEATGISGEADPWQACAALRALGAGSVIVKCGAEGSYGLDDSGRHRVRALDVRPADAVGAGDSYDAGFLWGLSRGLSFEQAMVTGTAAASIYVERSHDRYPGADELAAFMASHPELAPSPARTPYERPGSQGPLNPQQEDSPT
jgi:ribokinase